MYSALSTYLCLLFLSTIFSETSSQLLPPIAGKNGLTSRSHKTFENGVVSCGNTFCDAKRCLKKAEKYECTDDE
ncbi:unnamed protein product [Cylicocyclus nassatus]|uniref:Secreted protein n=1 Tax=Cylicocyclus nassatus TaxID=53992 RepID=A0AA36GXT1_CYLNA|nr:unnamed protein product [Cylicocyclus nassatus]